MDTEVQEQTSPEAAARIAELREASARAEALVGPLDDDAFNWRPEPGVWSVGQNLDHLATAASLYLERLPAVIDDARQSGPFHSGQEPRRGWLGRFFIWSMEPPPRFKVKAPARFVPRQERLARSGVMTSYQHVHAELERCFHRAGTLDLWRVKCPLPTIPQLRLSLGEIFVALLAHERRHLLQAETLRARPDFPAPRAD